MQVKRKRRQTAPRHEPVPVGRTHSLWDRCFWTFASSIILVATLTRAFDYSLVPPSYRGMFVTRPTYGLHSDITTRAAWAARSHVRYGLGYTKGFRTLVVGDPPPGQPQREVGQPPLESWIVALGMKLLGTHEWSIRLVDMILSVPTLVLAMLLTRRFCGHGCALLAGLLLAVFPLSAYFGFGPLLMLLGLWVLWRYLALIGAVGKESESKPWHSLELAVALFVLIQLTWAGAFYALTLGVHHSIYVAVRRRVHWPVLAVLAIAPLLSLALNVYVMMAGHRLNIAAEAETKRPAQFVVDRGGVLPPLVQELGPDRKDTAWGRVKAQFGQWTTGGERGLFPSGSYLATIARHAGANFSPAVLVFLCLYVIYFAAAHITVWLRRVLAVGEVASKGAFVAVRRPFVHMWFFLLPGLLFLLVFKGLAAEHPQWQAPLALFVAVGAALGILLIGDVFTAIHRLFGGVLVATLTIISVVFCNEALADWRAVRSLSPRTLALFSQLSEDIPPGQALLTYKDFTTRRSEAEAPTCRPEYAWLLGREMVVANAWHYSPHWAGPAQIDEVVDETIGLIQRQAQTGHFAYYLVPARERPDHDPLYFQSRKEQLKTSFQRMGLPWEPEKAIGLDEANEVPPSLAALDPNELEQRLSDQNWSDDMILYWEKHRRYRETVIARLKKLYHHQYYDNPAVPGDDDFDREGDTPCYLFDLSKPRQ